MDYNTIKKSELIKLCKENNIKNYSDKNKNQLIEMLENKKEFLEPPNENNISEYLDINDLINKIINTECIEMMQKIPSNSIDMICTDPPYFLDGLCDNWNKKSIDDKGSSSLVGNLPKGMKFDRNQSRHLLGPCYPRQNQDFGQKN